MKIRLTVIIFGILFTPCYCLKLDVFSTKTLYEWANSVSIPPAENSYSSFLHGNGVCDAVHVYVVARHGARYPSDGTMEDMPGLFAKIRDYKDPTKFTGFDNWTNRYEISKESQLVQAGIEEHVGLGERLATRFLRLFQTHGDRVKFISSYKTRASNSSKYFYQGMVNITSDLPMYENAINNTLTRYYDGCYNYENGVEDNDTHLMEFHKYENTSDFISVREAIETRLGLNATLTQDDVYLIYEMCAYEKYIYGEEIWCDLLTDAEREILEYGQDLEKYYESGYTAPIIQKMTCPLVHDILDTLNSSKSDTWDYMSASTNFSDTGYLAGKFLFGHSETLVPLLTALDMFKDSTPLLASNRVAQQNRLFKTSHIAPFSTNIAIAMYACNDTTGSQMNRSFVIKVYFNEMEATIPACNDTVCSYDDFVTAYSPITENCDLTQICGSEDDNDPSGAVHVIGTFLSVILPLHVLLVLYLP